MKYFFRGSTRKFRVGKKHAKYVMENYHPVLLGLDRENMEKYLWIGKDLKDRDLEVIAVFFPEYWDVIHVMPVKLRERESGGYRGTNW